MLLKELCQFEIDHMIKEPGCLLEHKMRPMASTEKVYNFNSQRMIREYFFEAVLSV